MGCDMLLFEFTWLHN